MIQLPYREHESLSGGGEITDHNRSNELLGSTHPKTKPFTIDSATLEPGGKPKRNSKSYKTELKAMTKERNRWRAWFWILGAAVIITLLLTSCKNTPPTQEEINDKLIYFQR